MFLTNVNTSGPDWTPDISADGLTLLFMRNPGPTEIWASTRRTTDDDFGAPIRLPRQVNMPGYDNAMPHLSADGSTLYFMSSRPGGFGGWDLWQVSASPVVDFNGDSRVDGADICVMVDHWGTDEPLCDIGPMPWGDSIVDVQDLTVLAGYIGAEIDDPTLVAHWPLDEADGMIVSDHAGDHHGTVIGLPVWQPAGGQVGGALQLDGATFVAADSVLSPADGPFSVLAWVKGGVPGQAVLSQQGAASWLSTNPLDGSLMTELTVPGRNGKPLFSDAVITDGQWHRIGLVWDGTNRILLVDEQEVARDERAGLAVPEGSLMIGCGKAMVPGSFFTGLIDDVRVYNRAVKP